MRRLVAPTLFYASEAWLSFASVISFTVDPTTSSRKREPELGELPAAAET